MGGIFATVVRVVMTTRKLTLEVCSRHPFLPIRLVTLPNIHLGRSGILGAMCETVTKEAHMESDRLFFFC